MKHRFASFLRRLRHHRGGAALVEFALTAPLFLLLIMGFFDYAWQMYAKQVLQGAVAEAARAATLEDFSDNQAALDERVRSKVQTVMAHATLHYSRKAYESYDDVGDPENFTDRNNNGRYDAGECFEDVNGNESWDSDRGAAGNGGADDVVLYTVQMRFKRLLPVWAFLGQPQESTLTSSTVLRNQPYTAGSSKSKVIC